MWPKKAEAANRARAAVSNKEIDAGGLSVGLERADGTDGTEGSMPNKIIPGRDAIVGDIVGTEDLHGRIVTITVDESRVWRSYLGTEELTSAKSRQDVVVLSETALAGGAARVEIDATLVRDRVATPITIIGVSVQGGRITFKNRKARGNMRGSDVVMRKLEPEELEEYQRLVGAVLRFEEAHRLPREGTLKSFVLSKVRDRAAEQKAYHRK